MAQWTVVTNKRRGGKQSGESATLDANVTVANLLAQASQLMAATAGTPGPGTGKGQGKGGPKPTKDQWVCSHCNKDNWVTRHQCRNCGLKKEKQGRPKTSPTGPNTGTGQAGPAKLAPWAKGDGKGPVPPIQSKPPAKETAPGEGSSSTIPDTTVESPGLKELSRAELKEELVKIDGALAAMGDMDPTDPISIALQKKKEGLKDALNMKKSVGTRLDWALRQESKAREAVSSLEEDISSKNKELADLEAKLEVAKQEAEDAHNHVVNIKADVAADPDLETKEASVSQDVVNHLADNIVAELSRYPRFAPGTEQVRHWIRTQMETKQAATVGEEENAEVIPMEGRRECKNREAPEIEGRASKRRGETPPAPADHSSQRATQGSTIPAAPSAFPPVGASQGQPLAPTQLDVEEQVAVVNAQTASQSIFDVPTEPAM